MPELPEVETVRLGLEKYILGRRILSAQKFRRGLRNDFPQELEKVLGGYAVNAVKRRGKYIIISESAEKPSLVMHLGMSGKLIACLKEACREPEKHDHLLLKLDNGTTVVFNDPRRFGSVFLAMDPEHHPALSGMGPEPLDQEFTAEILLQSLKRTGRPLKTALMDQKVVAGLGNIYVCEALFEAGLSPFRKSSGIRHDEAERLA